MKRTTAAIILCALLAVAGACGSAKKDSTATEAGAASAEKPAETTVSTASTDSTASTTSTTAASTTTTAYSGAPASGTSEADFAAQANALCAKFNDEASAVEQPTSTAPAAMGDYLEQALAQFDQQIAQMKTLSPPTSEAAAWAAILQVVDGQRATIAAYVPRLKAGDTTAMAEMLAMTPVDLDSQFDALGMTTCGSASSN